MHYDFIIAGAGLSGLSLALHLINSPLRDRSILIVDRAAKDRNDRTWSYWSDRPTLFDGLACRTWDRLHLAGLNGELRVNLRRYRYRTIRGSDFYQHARRELSRRPNVTWRCGQVQAIEGDREAARVIVDREAVTGQWAFDGIPRPVNAPVDRRYHYLKLHFKGWEIETVQPVFDPGAATFLDFRMPHTEQLPGAIRFFYVLPFDERHALVEYTLFSARPLLPREYGQALQAYLREVLGIADYRILRQEGGVMPITDRPYPRRLGQRVMAIGMRGGRLKPTTGFAFTRVQADSAAIVQSLLEHDQPFDVPEDSARYRLYDSMLLDIMEREPERIQPIFAALFRRSSIEHVLSFLDERASLAQNIRMFANLPPAPFLQALARVGMSRERVMVAGQAPSVSAGLGEQDDT
jgi:lycopene beta-cyclase